MRESKNGTFCNDHLDTSVEISPLTGSLDAALLRAQANELRSAARGLLRAIENGEIIDIAEVAAARAIAARHLEKASAKEAMADRGALH